jgi:hypothetical protein
VPSKPRFIVTYRGPTFFNVSFDPAIMAIPGSLYYVQYKEDENGLYKANVSTTNKIIF